jgi:hypothetical protein
MKDNNFGPDSKTAALREREECHLKAIFGENADVSDLLSENITRLEFPQQGSLTSLPSGVVIPKHKHIFSDTDLISKNEENGENERTEQSIENKKQRLALIMERAKKAKELKEQKIAKQ